MLKKTLSLLIMITCMILLNNIIHAVEVPSEDTKINQNSTSFTVLSYGDYWEQFRPVPHSIKKNNELQNKKIILREPTKIAPKKRLYYGEYYNSKEEDANFIINK